MPSILTLTPEAIKAHKAKLRAEKAQERGLRKRKPAMDEAYEIITHSQYVDELDDVHWNPNDQIQVRHMMTSMDLISAEFGEYANLTLTAHKRTLVEFQTCMHLPSDTEVPNCRGRNAQFYHGFRAASIMKPLSDMRLDYSRASHWALIRHFLAGYLQCFAFMQAAIHGPEGMQAEAPYGMGVLAARRDIDTDAVNGLNYPQGEGSPREQLVAKGYHEYLKAYTETRPRSD